MTGGKGLAVGALLALGTLSAFGCALAVLFELQGFGAPREEGPRPLYLLALAFGLLLSIFLPVLAWRRLLPRTAPAWSLVLSVLFAVLVFVLLGLSLTN